jgi:putative ABC transport system ATP-binding protein
VGSPRLLLADEPTGDLDAATGERLQGLLAELARARGLTVVVVTHNAALARSCDRVLRLESGRLAPA